MKKYKKLTEERINYIWWLHESGQVKKKIHPIYIKQINDYVKKHPEADMWEINNPRKGRKMTKAEHSRYSDYQRRIHNLLYTAKELAGELKVNIMTIYRYIGTGKLEAYKIGKEFRIKKEDFDKFLNKTKTR